MSKENEEHQVAKFCVYCGTTIQKNTAYCPNPECGKLVVNIKPSEDITDQAKAIPKSIKKEPISRKCSNCGSIITSNILEQCPICDSRLEKIPEQEIATQGKNHQSRQGYVFTNKKLVSEQKFVLKKSEWNFREGISVFGNALMAYITVRLVITMLLTLQLGPSETLDLNMTTILLSQAPDIIFGVYPLYYIYSKRHSLKKLGLIFNTKALIIATLVGIAGSIGLVLIDNFSSLIIRFMYDAGINFYDIFGYLDEEYLVLQNSSLILMILLILLLSLSVISTELVFRGVLHKTLKAHFGNSFLGKVTVIVIVALVYSILFLFFTLPVGIYFFLVNFMVSIFLGVIYEINKNLFSTIMANLIYNITLIILIVYF
ncbi:MAG TPA: CPBP family intramembrane glutamic endopeptidase [Candidatus Nanopelagicaceae bacterium]|nr:CPBP family intramembrane glutamic endopeptidase [Candidatus Nanopelagicaceae bacterium]